AELVFQQLADRAHAPVAQVIDVVDDSDVLAQLQNVFDDAYNVLNGQGSLVNRGIESQLDVEFQAPDARKIVLSRIKEHAGEQRLGRIAGRHVTGSLLAVNFKQRLFVGFLRILVRRILYQRL